jgi:alpha-glucosidase (family GH31 glycosyl hydrolase)
LDYTNSELQHRISGVNWRLEVNRNGGTWELFREDRTVLESGPEAAGEFAPLALGSGESILAGSYVGDGVQRGDGGLAFPLSQSQMGPVVGSLVVTATSEHSLRLTLVPWEPPVGCGFAFSIPSAGHWYGQGQLTRERNLREGQNHDTSQFFPLDIGSYERPVLTSDEGTNVLSPMWLTQSGVVLFVDAYSYLDVSFNRETNGLFKLHLIPREGEDRLSLDVILGENPLEAYRHWVSTRFSVRPDLPVGARPADDLFTKPIWTTWAYYKSRIDQQKVSEFAKAIHDHGYQASYVEIDDKWTPTYGDLVFDTERFPDPRGMVREIHDLGFKVSAWVTPFVNMDAAAWQEGIEAQAFVPSSDPEVEYPPAVGWWNSLGLPMSAIVDFTRREGREWWGKKVDGAALTYGLDGYKYDAGETQFLPRLAKWEVGVPENAYPDYYASWAMEHQGVEIRAAWFSQNLPIAVRQFDKESIWGLNNGLASVMTQALAMGLIGYPFVLPDMVGGNEYSFQADEELFLRWVQLNTWLPMVQFSVLPWREEYDPRVNHVTRAYMDFRKTLGPYLLELADDAAATQLPMARPLFFEFPGDSECYGIPDQFMLGRLYLVAPVLTQGAVHRDVYLPKGQWQVVEMPSGEAGEIHQGPKVLQAFPAALESVPVFKLLP